MVMKQKISSKWFEISTLLTLLIIGLLILPDFGIHVDDIYHKAYGEKVFQSFEKLQDHSQWVTPRQAMHHGGMGELILGFIPEIIKRGGVYLDSQIEFFIRHLAIFLVYLLGIYFFYQLSQKFLNQTDARIATLLYIIHPHIFAHSFFNPVDMPFITFFIIGIYTLFQFFEKKNLKTAVIHLFASAVVVDVRVIGLFIPVLTIGLILMRQLFYCKELEKELPSKDMFKYLAAYLILLPILVYIFWPYLWSDPLGSFWSAITNTSVEMLSISWTYTLSHILLTTPILIVLGSLIGLSYISFSFFKRPSEWKSLDFYNFILFLWIILPIGAAILTKARVYDGWRHHFFTYPALVIFCVQGFNYILAKYKSYQPQLNIGIALAVLITTLPSFILLHPYQHTYYNLIRSWWNDSEKQLHLDYGGISSKEALESIASQELKQQDQKTIVLTEDPSALINLKIIAKNLRNKLKVISLDMLPLYIRVTKNPCLEEFAKRHAWKYHFKSRDTLVAEGWVWEEEKPLIYACLDPTSKEIVFNQINNQRNVIYANREQIMTQGDYLFVIERPIGINPKPYDYPIFKQITRGGRVISTIYQLKPRPN